MNDKLRILTIGAANMDLVMPLERMPAAGETMISAESPSMTPGGKGANQATAVARLGARSVFCASVGADSTGDRLRALYTAEGIDCRFLTASPDHATGTAAVFCEPGGVNRIVVYPGANNTLTHEQIDDAFSCMPDAVLLQLELPFDTVLYAAHAAAARGVPIIMDAAPADPRLPLDALPGLEIFSPNEIETEQFSGIRPGGAESCLQAAMALTHKVRAKYYVIKMGDRGCFLFDGRMPRYIAAYHTQVVDTTAAGDSFTAALAVAYLASEGNIRSACAYANAAGAVAVSRFGASEATPTAAEIEAFLRQA
ncbi:MAG: ribokinase [Clostridia bacterium]|nr:ribokinase [Clostridia bacterium]